MGNEFSGQTTGNDDKKEKPAYVEFLSSAGKTIGQASGVVCGSLNDTFEEVDATDRGKSSALLSSKRAKSDGFMNPEDDESLQANPMSQLFARALLTEVTDNPSTMTPMKMAEREKRLLRAQQRANSASKGMRAIGGQGTMKSQLQGASQRIIPPNLLSEHRAQVRGNGESSAPRGKHSVTIGLMLSRRDAEIGHPDTVTRQSGFNFNDLQDREYKYVSSTDASGWRAGGGEKGGPPIINDTVSHSLSDENDHDNHLPSSPKVPQSQKIPAPDMVHIPIIHIDCDSDAAVNAVIAALARGEVFIPHMSVTPEALGVNGISPPDLVVRFGCERNDDFPPEEWPNWCLEFMHNQLYEYFSDMGARWMKRPFQITLAKKVRWKTVKHMNKFFAHSETVINTWREKGPQYLNPQLAHIEGGATPEEVARPHGIYLLRNGKPTNYFAPNFEPPYTTKMTRSLVQNVLAKSWDKKRRDWSTSPIPIVTPGLLFSTMCGCAEPNQGGFIAREATEHFSPIGGGSTFFSENDLTLNTNAQHDRQLMQNIRIPREDSGITRSKIEIVDSRGKSPSLASSGNRDNSSVVSGRSSSVSRVTDSSADHSSDNYRYGQENIQSIFGNSLATESNQTEESGGDYSNESDEKIHAASNHSNYHDDTITSSPQQHMESPLKHGNQSINSKNDDFVEEDPQDYQLNNVVRNDEVSPRPQPVSHGAYSGEEKPTRSTSPQEGYGSQSVGESQTTAPIMNRSSTSFIEQERQRRKQREVEREKERKKIDELELAIQEKLRLHVEKRKKEVNPEAASVALEMPDADVEFKKKYKKEKKAKKEKKKRDKKERRERERSSSRQRASSSDAEDNWNTISESRQFSKENQENRKLSTDPVNSDSPGATTVPKLERRTIGRFPDPGHDSSYLPVNLNGSASPQKRNQNLFVPNSPASTQNMEINSSPSMDYSLDTASLLGDGSLVGGQFAGDSSVFTMGTNASDNKSLLSCVTRSTIHDMTSKQKKKEIPASQPDEDDDISLSLMASTSTGNGDSIPSDDELFGIGWAKALDPSSECYYYFTLDRSKTVWENPLVTQDI